MYAMHSYGQNFSNWEIRSLDPDYWVKVKLKNQKLSQHIDCCYRLKNQPQIFRFRLIVIKEEGHVYFEIDKPDQTVGLDYLQLSLAILKDKQCNQIFDPCRQEHYVRFASLGMPLADIAFLNQIKKQDYPLIYFVILTMSPIRIVLDPDTAITKELLAQCLGVEKLSSGQLHWLRKIEFPNIYNMDYLTCVKKAIQYVVRYWDCLPPRLHHEKRFRADTVLIYLRLYQLMPDIILRWNNFALFRVQQLNFTHHYLFRHMLYEFNEEIEDTGFCHEQDGKSTDPIEDELSCCYTYLAIYLTSICRFLQSVGVCFNQISDLRTIYDRFIDHVILHSRSGEIEGSITENEKCFPAEAVEKLPALRLLVTRITLSAYGYTQLIPDDQPFKCNGQLIANKYFTRISNCGQLRAISKQLENCAERLIMYGINGFHEFWVYKDWDETALLKIDIRDPPHSRPICEFSTTRNKPPSSKAKRRLTLWMKSQPIQIKTEPSIHMR